MRDMTKASYIMTDDDRDELARIDRAAVDVVKDRIRFFAKLRQRAFRARKQVAPPTEGEVG